MIPRFLATVLLAGVCLAQNPETRMDQIVQSYVSDKKFMGTVLVAKGDQVLLSKGYGSANLEWSIPNTPSTKFRLGSLTKQFTAASILLLEQQGKLKTDDLVKKYVPNAPAAWDRMTIFNVLTHTAGIPNFTSFPDYPTFSLSAMTPEKLVGTFLTKPLDFQPGEQWSYSNSGYALLGYLIEKVSGQTYEKFLQENIFTPLAMKDSGYDSNTAVITRRAMGYNAPPNGAIANAGYVHMSVPFSAGALYSTTEDLLKWEQGLFGGKVISTRSLEKMTTPFKNNYAFGVGVQTVNGHKLVDHNGGIQGFNTHLSYYPNDKLTVAVLSNLTGNGPAPDQMAPQLAQVAFGDNVTLLSERKEITLTPAILDRYRGIYKMAVPPGGTMIVAGEGNQLSTQLVGQPPLPIFAQSETMFFAKAVDAQIEFPATAANAKAPQLTLHQNGRELVGTRMSDAEAKPLLEAAAATAQRIKDQKASPGSEAALRRVIEETRAGTPNYELMSANLAAATRQQLPQLQAMITRLGALKALTFTGVGPAGADIYAAKFETGALEYRIMLQPEGKIETLGVRPSN
jgi:CubicO group peptidase (beta-lactamase class C family)